MVSRQLDAQELLAHAGFVRAIARALLSPDRADDVVQETMLAAVRRPPRGRLKPWLAAVARRLALKDRRREVRLGQRERRAARSEAVPGTADAVTQLETQRRLVEAVLALDEPYRTTVVDRYFHGRRSADIAEDGDVSVRTVETRLRRARAQLRARLDEDDSRWRSILLPLAGGTVMTKSAKGIAVLATLAVGISGVAAWRSLDREPASRRVPTERAERDRSDSGAPTPEPEQNAVPDPVPNRTPVLPHPSRVPETGPDRIVGFVTIDGKRDFFSAIGAGASRIESVPGLSIDLRGKTASGVEVSRRIPVDAAPWFVIPNLEPGIYLLTARAKGYAAPKFVRVTLSPNRESFWRMHYPVPLVPAGRVRIVAPPGTLVSAVLNGEAVLRERTDRDGDLIWHPAQAGTYELSAGDVSRTLRHTAPDANAEVQLVPDALLFGRVEGFANAHITFFQGKQSTSAKLDDDAAFRIQGLPPGTYEIVVLRFGKMAVVRKLEVPRRRGRLYIPLAPTRVTGQVLRPSGEPWRGHRASVSVRSARWTRSVLMDEKGRYEIVGLRPGEYLLAGHVNYGGHQMPVRRIDLRPHVPLSADFTIGPQVFGKLLVVLVDEDGQPIEDATLMVAGPDTPDVIMLTHSGKRTPGGVYEMKLEAGKHKLNYQGQTREFVVRPGMTDRVTWTVKRRGLAVSGVRLLPQPKKR